MKIFINGLQRTGTNYALKLFQANVSNTSFVDYAPGHWKHDFYNGHFLNNPSKKILSIIKHPYSWIESVCFRNCVDIKTYFPNYYLHTAQDGCGLFQINLKNLCELYYDWYNTWLDVPQVTLIKYERLLTQKNIKKEIIKHFNILSNQIKIPNKIPFSDNYDLKRNDGYINHKTQHLNDLEKQIIKECLSKEFLIRINYNLS